MIYDSNQIDIPDILQQAHGAPTTLTFSDEKAPLKLFDMVLVYFNGKKYLAVVFEKSDCPDEGSLVKACVVNNKTK